jgi:hypothetical protein
LFVMGEIKLSTALPVWNLFYKTAV